MFSLLPHASRRLLRPATRSFSSNLATQVPVIDIAPFLDQSNPDQVVEQVLRASHDVGFFYITGHGVPQRVTDNTFAHMRQFFEQPDAVKMTLHSSNTQEFKGYIGMYEQGNYGIDDADARVGDEQHAAAGNAMMDCKEVFHIGTELPASHPFFVPLLYGPNVWPRETDVPGFRAALEEYYSSVLDLSDDMFGLFARCLGLPRDFFQGKIESGMNTCNFVHYPPTPTDMASSIGIGEHTDFECFTILAQYPCPEPCLEIFDAERTGKWVQVPTVEGAFVVNVGDMMARWSNGKLRSTIHRAKNPPGSLHRYSVAFFRAPNYDVELGNLIVGEEDKYPSVGAGEHLIQRIQKANEVIL